MQAAQCMLDTLHFLALPAVCVRADRAVVYRPCRPPPRLWTCGLWTAPGMPVLLRSQTNAFSSLLLSPSRRGRFPWLPSTDLSTSPQPAAQTRTVPASCCRVDGLILISCHRIRMQHVIPIVCAWLCGIDRPSAEEANTRCSNFGTAARTLAESRNIQTTEHLANNASCCGCAAPMRTSRQEMAGLSLLVHFLTP